MRGKTILKIAIAFVLTSSMLLFGCGEMEKNPAPLPTVENDADIETLQVADATESTEDAGYVQGTEEAEFVPGEDEQPEQEADDTIRIIMIGDMLMHKGVMKSGLQEDGSYSYLHFFKNIATDIEDADIAIVNQETILGGTELGLSGYPLFNSPKEIGAAEAEAGFDVVLFGTNHALDKGAVGLNNTIEFFETNYPDVAYLGINKSQEAQDTYIYTFEKGDITVAVLNYTYGTNGIPTPQGMPYAVNYLDENRVVSDLARANELADFVVVCPHWGTEYSLTTDSYQKKWVDIFLKNGVDLVIGAHPHVIEPIEWVNDEEGNEMLVYYSLGNFVTGTSSTGSNVARRVVSGMADVTIGRNEDGEAVILENDVLPLICHEGTGEQYTVYPIDEYTQELADVNWINDHDSNFSLQFCKDLVYEVWGK